MAKTHWKCKRCGYKLSNPLAVCELIEGTPCNKKEGTKGFQGWV